MSATNTLELRFFESVHPKDQSTTGPSSKSLANSKVSSDTSRLVDDAAKDVTSTLPGPATRIVEAQKRWNSSRSNVWRVFVTFLSFIVMGANDAAYGVQFCFFNLFWFGLY